MPLAQAPLKASQVLSSPYSSSFVKHSNWFIWELGETESSIGLHSQHFKPSCGSGSGGCVGIGAFWQTASNRKEKKRRKCYHNFDSIISKILITEYLWLAIYQNLPSCTNKQAKAKDEMDLKIIIF